MKNLKRLLAMLICMIMIISVFPAITAFAETDSGTCGNSIKWTFTGNTLSITGEGEMTSYSSYNTVPWYDHCASIVTITISEGVTNIGSYAFYDCASLTGITIPDSVTNIGKYAFYNCSSLTGISVPNSVTAIGDNAFSLCSSLESFDIPEGITTIESYTFFNCSSLKSMVIPDSVTIIEDWAFYNCSSLESISISSNVTSIGSWVFAHCRSLTNIQLPVGITTVADWLFFNCLSLTEINVPNNVTSIGNWVFYNCASLKSITIPESVKSIGNYSFDSCTSLEDVYYTGTEEQWNEIRIESSNTYLTNTTTIHYDYIIQDGGDTSADVPEDAGESTSIVDQLLSHCTLTIYENKNTSEKSEKYILSEGATVIAEGVEYTSDEDGEVSLAKDYKGSIEISKEGFVSRTIGYEEYSENYTVYLQRDSGDAPIINSVIVDGTNVLYDDYEIDILSEKSVTLTADIKWMSGEESSVYLYQSGKTAKFSGGSLTMVLSDKFDVSETIYIVVIDTEKNSTKRELKITTTEFLLDGFELSFNDKLSFALPDSVPLIGGKKVSVGLDEAVTSAIPVQYSISDRTLYVAIGVDLISYSNKQDENDPEKRKKEWKNFVDKVKDAFATKDTKKVKTIAEKYKDVLAKPKGSIGWSADITIMGFAEGYINSDYEIEWLDAGLIFKPSVSASADGSFALGPVPCYWEASFKAELEAQLNLLIGEAAKNFIPEGEVSLTVSLSGGVGAGIKKVATIGGGITGSLPILWKLRIKDVDYVKIDGKLDAYFKVTVFFVEYKKNFELAKKTLYEYPSATSMSLAGEEMELLGLYDINNYSLVDRSYAQDASEFTANDSMGLLELSNVTEQTFKTNVYTYSDPQMADFGDGTRMIVWLDDDGTRSDINRTCLYYSYYDGSEWSEPCAVDDDGTADFAPKIEVIEGKAYVVWVNADEVLDDDADTVEAASHFEINAAVFDGTEFAVYTLTDNDTYDTLPIIYDGGEKVCAAWVNNADNDVFCEGSENSVMVSEFDGEWSEPTALNSSLGTVDCLSGSEFGLAYTVDTDGDIETSADTEIYLNGEQITDNDVLDTAPYFCGGKLYYYSGTGIYEADTESDAVSEIVENAASDNFIVIRNGEDKAILFTKSDYLTSEVCAYIYSAENDAWSEEIALTDMGMSIMGFDGCYADGKIMLVMNASEVNEGEEDPYGATSIIVSEIMPTYDLEITDVFYDPNTLVANYDVDMTVTLKNNGAKPVGDYQLEILDENGDMLDYAIYTDVILPGEEVEISFPYTLTDTVYIGAAQMVVSMNDGEEDDTSNNTYDMEITLDNYAVSSIGSGTRADGTIVIYADIVNYGYSAGDIFDIELTDKDGNVLQKTTLSGLDTLMSERVSFEVADTGAVIYYINIARDDDNVGDNQAFILLETVEAESEYAYVINYIIAEETNVNVSITGNIESAESVLIVAAYDEVGEIIGVKRMNISDITGDIVEVEMNVTNAAQISAFVWNNVEEMKPMSEKVMIEFN